MTGLIVIFMPFKSIMVNPILKEIVQFISLPTVFNFQFSIFNFQFLSVSQANTCLRRYDVNINLHALQSFMVNSILKERAQYIRLPTVFNFQFSIPFSLPTVFNFQFSIFNSLFVFNFQFLPVYP